jgi:hypothetical protein
MATTDAAPAKKPKPTEEEKAVRAKKKELREARARFKAIRDERKTLTEKIKALSAEVGKKSKEKDPA